MENQSKRPFRIIQTWNLLEEKYPEWKLTFVGDGPDRNSLENKVKDLGLKRVTFVGFQNPVKYYQRASILMLTSDIEGFLLVLAECMSFGVVPVVYASYPAVYDIVKDEINGIIIPKRNEFPTELAAKKISEIIESNAKRLNMSLSAIKESHRFSINKICEQWENRIQDLYKQ